MGTTFEVFIATLDPVEVSRIQEKILASLRELGYRVEIREVHQRVVIK